MQTIEIRNLGPVKNLKMDIKDFNLIIGEQATGKSTVAKAIYFFRIIKTTLIDYLCQVYDTSLYNGSGIERGFNNTIKKELKSIFISLFGFSWDLDDHLYMRYEYATEIWIDVVLNQGVKKYISVRFSPKLTDEIKKMEKDVLNLYHQRQDSVGISLAYASKERMRNYENIKNSVNAIFDDDKETYYIPAGRSMITLLVNNRSMIQNENLDLITRQFMQIIDNIHGSFTDGIQNAHKRYPDGERTFDVSKVADMIVSDLKGDYRYESGNEYFIMQDRNEEYERIPINFASSGQQEVLWLLNQLYILMLKKEKAFVIIEEPEAHLYPELQSRVIEFISFFANMNHSSVFVTTHSPYILTSVNILYCAGKAIRKYPELKGRVYEVIGRKREIEPEKITAFKINRNEVIENLVDEEMGEIKTELIDEISDSINDKYAELFYLISGKEDD